MNRGPGDRERKRWRGRDGQPLTLEQVYGTERAAELRAKSQANRTKPAPLTSFARRAGVTKALDSTKPDTMPSNEEAVTAWRKLIADAKDASLYPFGWHAKVKRNARTKKLLDNGSSM